MGAVAHPTLLSDDDIRAAVAAVAPWVRRTPVLEIEVDGTPVTLKLELFQHSGSFKVRGAFHNVLSAPEPPQTLVAASGGNHGLAVAHVGHRLGLATALRAVGVASHSWDYRDWHDGTVIARLPLAEAAVDRWGEPFYNIHRAEDSAA